MSCLLLQMHIKVDKAPLFHQNSQYVAKAASGDVSVDLPCSSKLGSCSEGFSLEASSPPPHIYQDSPVGQQKNPKSSLS